MRCNCKVIGAVLLHRTVHFHSQLEYGAISLGLPVILLRHFPINISGGFQHGVQAKFAIGT